MPCFYCGKLGHFIRTCLVKQADENSGVIMKLSVVHFVDAEADFMAASTVGAVPIRILSVQMTDGSRISGLRETLMTAEIRTPSMDLPRPTSRG